MNIPVLGTMLKYGRIFLEYAGYRLPSIVFISFFSGLTECIGLMLFIPLLNVNKEVDKTDHISKTFFSLLEYFNIERSVQVVLIFMLVVFFLKGLLVFTQVWVLLGIRINMSKKLMRNIMQRYSEMNYSYYLNSDVGYLTNVVTRETEQTVYQLTRYCAIVTSLIYIMFYSGWAFVLDWQMALVCVAFGVVLLIVFRSFNKRSRTYSFNAVGELTRLTSTLIQFINGFKYIRATNSFPSLYNAAKKQIDFVQDNFYKSGMLASIVQSLREPLSVLFLCSVIYLKACIYGNSIMPLMALLFFLYRIFMRFVDFQHHWQNFNACMGSINLYRKIDMETLDNKEDVGTVKVDSFDKELKFENVSFSFGNKKVIDNVSLLIEKNKSVAFVGPSGSGKTTLFDLVTGLLPPESGNISFDGNSYTDINKHSLRSLFGYVTQEPIIFTDTIKNNITLWKEADEERLKSVIKMAHCDNFVAEREEGLDTLLGDKGVKLSGGQRQRIAIARELYRQPHIMLFDEATSALDTESENHIRQSIDDLKGTRTMLIIAHRLSTIRNCDYIYVLDGGRIVEEGAFDELYSKADSAFRKMCEAQSLA
jgi:subfamily B ATP-binding cassette protein MsbA